MPAQRGEGAGGVGEVGGGEGIEGFGFGGRFEAPCPGFGFDFEIGAGICFEGGERGRGGGAEKVGGEEEVGEGGGGEGDGEEGGDEEEVGEDAVVVEDVSKPPHCTSVYHLHERKRPFSEGMCGETHTVVHRTARRS